MSTLKTGHCKRSIRKPDQKQTLIKIKSELKGPGLQPILHMAFDHSDFQNVSERIEVNLSNQKELMSIALKLEQNIGFRLINLIDG